MWKVMFMERSSPPEVVFMEGVNIWLRVYGVVHCRSSLEWDVGRQAGSSRPPSSLLAARGLSSVCSLSSSPFETVIPSGGVGIHEANREKEQTKQTEADRLIAGPDRTGPERVRGRGECVQKSARHHFASREGAAAAAAMADRRDSLVPSHLYRSAALSLLPRTAGLGSPAAVAPAAAPALYDPFARFRPYMTSKNAAGSKVNAAAAAGNFMIPSPAEPGKITMYSKEFYTACTIGGILSCGLTHTGVTPMDVVKCNMQIDPKKYTGIGQAFSLVLKEQGAAGLVRGWAPTLFGYSAQGACKFGLYEFFKKYYADLAGEEMAHNYKTLVYLAGSASAEFFADLALCPFEAIKVRVQTKPGFAKGLTDGFPKFVAAEGYRGLYKGLVPLWGRQIPYTMMKFACFEATVEALYKYVVPIPKSECSKGSQLGVSFAAGYIAGVFCAIVSHPADNLVSFLNNAKGATVGQAVSQMGMMALFTRGLPLRIVMIGTLTGAQWGIYDAFKVYVGLPTTGGAPPPVEVEKVKAL